MYQFGGFVVDQFQLRQCFVERENVFARLGQGDIECGEVSSDVLAAVPQPILAACFLHQDASHRQRGSREEMPPPLPFRFVGLGAGQSEVGLMNQGRRLQSLAWTLMGELRRRQFAKFVVNKRQQLCGSDTIAGVDPMQNL